MASHWHVRNTLPNKPWLASSVPPHSKVSNWMPPLPPTRNTNKYTKWVSAGNGRLKLAPINRSGWAHTRKRKNRKTRKNR